MGDVPNPVKMAKEAAADKKAEAIAALKALKGDFSGLVKVMWKRFKKTLTRITFVLILFLQILAASSTAMAECGVDGGDDLMIEGGDRPAESGYGNPNLEIGRDIYKEVQRRYAKSPDAPRVIEAAISTALVESNMQNVEHGDRDSLGVFQQRGSWGSKENRMNTKWATNAFLNALEKVRPNLPNAPSWELAQATQRSFCDNSQQNDPDALKACGGVYGGNYKQRTAQAKNIIKDFEKELGPVNQVTQLSDDVTRSIVSAGDAVTPGDASPDDHSTCASKVSTGGDFANMAGQKNVVVESKGKKYTLQVIPDGPRGQAISAALSQLGVNYVWAGAQFRENGKAGALDCSGLTQQALKRAGINVEKLGRYQYINVDKKLSNIGEAQPGDLIFWANNANPQSIHHVGFYLKGWVGDKPNGAAQDLVLHAPETGDVVKISPYWTEGNGSDGRMKFSNPYPETAPKAGATSGGTDADKV